jgi:lipoprotein Spr
MHQLYSKTKPGLALVFCLFAWGLVSSCRSHKEITKDDGAKKIKEKYSQALGVDAHDIKNVKLYSFIDDWYGTPYKYGGKSKTGIDCSDFVSTLQVQVYDKKIFPPAASMYQKCHTISRKDLKEGDLVFFKIESDKVSHVGVYLQNGCFVHASKSKGVMISRLDENYYKKYFFKGGRVE